MGNLDDGVGPATFPAMATVSLPLKRMTLAQKMEVLERVWDSVREQENKLESPAWHGEVLAERQQLVEEGKATFAPWDEVKERLHRKTRASRRS